MLQAESNAAEQHKLLRLESLYSMTRYFTSNEFEFATVLNSSLSEYSLLQNEKVCLI